MVSEDALEAMPSETQARQEAELMLQNLPESIQQARSPRAPGSQEDLASRRSDRSSADPSQRMCGRLPPGRVVPVIAGWSTIALPNRHRGGGARYHRACTLQCGPWRLGGPGMMSHRTMVPCSLETQNAYV